MADKNELNPVGGQSDAAVKLERKIAHYAKQARFTETGFQEDGLSTALALRQLYSLYRFANRDSKILIPEELTVRNMSERDLPAPYREHFADLISLLSDDASLENALPDLLERAPHLAFCIPHSDVETIKMVRNYEELRPSLLEDYFSRTQNTDSSLRKLLEGAAFFYGINPQDPADHARFKHIFRGKESPLFARIPLASVLYNAVGKEGFMALDFSDQRTHFPLHHLLSAVGAVNADDDLSQRFLRSFITTNYKNVFDPRDEESFKRTTDALREDVVRLAEYRAQLRSILGDSLLDLTHPVLLSALVKAEQRKDLSLFGSADVSLSDAAERPHLKVLYGIAADQLRDATLNASATCQSYLTVHSNDGLDVCEKALERDGKPLYTEMTTFWLGLPLAEAEDIYSLVKRPLFTR